MRSGTVSAILLRRIIDVGVSVGMRRDVLLQAAAVAEADLADPDARVPHAARTAVWVAIARFDPDPAVGVRAGANARVRQFGLLGYVACFSATLREVLQRAERYSGVLTEEAEFRLAEQRRTAVFSLSPLTPGHEQPISEDFRLAAWVQVWREVTGVEVIPLAVHVRHSQPRETLAYREHFRCPVHFHATSTCIELRLADLDLAVIRSDEMLAGYLSKYAEQVLASLVRGETWRHGVRAAIWSSLAHGKPSLARVAESLGVPPRTLQRRLAAEGTSLHREVEEIRKRMAMAILQDRSLSVADVSTLLGYAEPSVFFRSFRRWTGKTPREYRMQVA